MNRLWIIKMIFFSTARLVHTQTVKCCIVTKIQWVKSTCMKVFYLCLNVLKRNTTDSGYRIGKVHICHFLGDANRLKNLGTLIGLNRRDTHFRCNFYNTVKDG